MGRLLTTLARSGPPTRGLQGIWFLGRKNLLLDPRDFSSASWTKTRSYVAANCAADPTTGAYTVDKLVEDETASNNHVVTQSIAGATTKTYAVLIKAGERSKVLLWFGTASRGYGFDLAAGTMSAVTGLTAPTAYGMQAVGGGWYLCWITHATSATDSADLFILSSFSSYAYSGLGHQGTAAAGGSTTTAVLAAGASGTDSVYNGTEIIFSDAPTTIHTVTGYVGATKTATFTPARAGAPDATTYTVGPGIYIARASLNAGTTAYDFEDRGTQQTIPAYRGTAGTLQRGATTGAESSDPGLLNSGLSFVTDDILLSQTLAAMALGGPFTIYGVGIHNGTSTGTVLSLAAAGATTDYQRLAMNASGFVRIGSKAGAAAETNSADLAVSTTVPSVLALVHDGTTLTLHNVSAGTSVTLAAQAASGAARMGVGCTAGSTPAQQVTALTESVVAPFNVAHNAAERARMRSWLKGELAKPPYLLAVA